MFYLLIVTRVGLYVWADVLFEQLQEFARFSVPLLHGLLGVKQFPIYTEFKGTFCAGDKFKTINNVLIISQNFIRHPDGSCAVVSGYAVSKGYIVFLHVMPPDR